MPPNTPSLMSSELPIPSSLADKFFVANWMWTPEPGTLDVDSKLTTFPQGDRAFRRWYNSTAQVSSALVLITCDNSYTIYINGHQIGGGQDLGRADGFDIALSPGDNVFAVKATNAAPPPPPHHNPAGLITAIQINFSDGTSPDFLISDASWRTSANFTLPPDFTSPSLDDSTWVPSISLGTFSDGPFKQPTYPTISEDSSSLPPPVKPSSQYVMLHPIQVYIALMMASPNNAAEPQQS